MATGVAQDPRLLWNMTAGGIPFEADVNASGNQTSMRPPRGVFAEVPGATPKYAVNDGEVVDFREQMARMFLPVPSYKSFIEEFNTKPEAQQIAKVLGGTVSDKGNTHWGKGYIDFLLQNVQQSFQEKSQVVEVLADDHVAYFFGQAAPTFTYAGTLINTKQDDQAMNMLRLYQEMGRGTKLAERNTLLSIRYDGLIVSGAMLNLSIGLNAEMEVAVPFSFSLLVKQVIPLPNKYAGVVQLTKPFAVESDGYRPFEKGLGKLATTSVKLVAAPPVAESVTPAAAVKQPEPPASSVPATWAQRILSAVTIKTGDELKLQMPEIGPKY